MRSVKSNNFQIGYNVAYMRLSRIELSNFRSYHKQTYNLGELTVLVGRNGRGKTNLIEAINLLATGNSFRAGVTEEMILWGKEIATVTGIVSAKEGDYTSLTVILTPGKYLGKRTTKKRYLVDQVARSRARYLGHLVAVCFRPEDLRLIEGSPSRRRQYLDEILSQANQNYAQAVTLYEKALRRRNRLLDAIREGKARREQLSFWSATMIKNGNIMTETRRAYLEYVSGLETPFGKYRLEYDFSTISEARLAQYDEEEVAAGYTLVGPHKDDFFVLSDYAKQFEKNLHIYGSRGEQRLGVLFLKLGALSYLENKLRIKPLLLLDDIFSELDQEHRQEVVKLMSGRQTVITTAEEEVLGMGIGADIIRL